MATVVITNTGSNSNMRLRVTYSNGNGSITITKLEGCRVDGYDTLAYNAGNTNDNRVYLSIGGVQVLNVHEDHINFTKNSNYSTIWSGSVSRSGLSGGTSVAVSFTASQNSNVGNAYFETSIDAGYSNPTISIKNNGYDGNHRLNMTASALSFTVTLGNMNSRTGTLTYDGNSLGTRAQDGDWTVSIPAASCSSYLSAHNNSGNLDFSIAIKIDLGSGLSATAYLYIHVSDTIVPTMSSVSISGSTAVDSTKASLLNGKFIQNLTKPIITFSGNGANGSTISSYTLESITGISGSASGITGSTYQATKPFGQSGSVTATAKCVDSRSRWSSSKTSTAVTVIPYSLPVVRWDITRCDSDKTLNNDGVYCLLTATYAFAPITSSGTNLNQQYKKIEFSLDNNTWTEITLDNNVITSGDAWSGTLEKLITNTNVASGQPQEFSTSLNYSIYLRYTDISGSIKEDKTLNVAFTLISRRAGGKGLTLGRIATENDFHVYMDAYFHGAVYGLINSVYPVGSIYMSVDNVNADPNNLFPGTTWVRISQGKYIIGLDENNTWFNRVGSTGSNGNSGSWEHSHTHSHTHWVNGVWHSHGAGSLYTAIAFNSSYLWNQYSTSYGFTANARKNVSGTSNSVSQWISECTPVYGDTAGTTPGGTTSNEASTTATSSNTVVSPFYAVYIWKRTA